MLKILKMLLVGTALVGMPALAAPVIVTFDDLPAGVIPDGYNGIDWDGNWSVAVNPSYPYTPHSGTNAAYVNQVGYGEVDFSFEQPVNFVGAYFALAPSNSVYFNLYDMGQLVWTSQTLVPCTDANPGDPVCDNAQPGTNPPRFLPSGYYSNPVDEVGVFADLQGYYTMDDVVFNNMMNSTGTGAGSVPEPGSGSIVSVCMLVLGFAYWRRRTRLERN